MKVPTYLILSTAKSGRRGLCIDVCKNVFENSKVKVLISTNEPPSEDDNVLESLKNVEVIKYTSSIDAFEKLLNTNPEENDVVLFIADSTINLADAIENFKLADYISCAKLTRIWSIIDCKMYEMFTKKVEGYIEALSHFADCVLLSQRSGVSNSTVNELVSRFNKQCKPHLIVYMDKHNTVENTFEIAVDEARRISMLFDDYDLIDDLEFDEENLPEEPFSLERKPDPYLEKLQNGNRKNPIPDISEYAKKAHV